MKKDMNSELNSLIEQWKNSSPYAQERLQLLKKIINLNGENKLYNEEEQIKFNIKKDEYIIFTFQSLPYFKYIANNKMVVLVGIIGIVYFISYYLFKAIEIDNYFAINQYLYANPILLLVIFVLFAGNIKENISITNKNIYFKNKHLPIKCLLIKNSINTESLKKKKILKNINMVMFMGTYRSNSIHIPDNNINNLYILDIISYLSDTFKLNVYICPVFVDERGKRLNAILSFFELFGSIFTIFLYAVYGVSKKKSSEMIELSYSSMEGLKNHLNYSFNKYKELHEIKDLNKKDDKYYEQKIIVKFSVKRNFFSIPTMLTLNNNKICVNYNNKELNIDANLWEKNILKTNEKYIFIFTNDVGRKILFYKNTKDIDVPLLSIIEMIYKKKVRKIVSSRLLVPMWIY